MRYFTVTEAQALIPELEDIFRSALEIHAQAEAKAELLRRMEGAGGPAAQIALERAQLEFLVSGMNEWLQKVLDLGAIPKGVDPALVDFPHRLSGREVYLCWKLGEREISYYHGLEEGFGGRKALTREAFPAPDSARPRARGAGENA